MGTGNARRGRVMDFGRKCRKNTTFQKTQENRSPANFRYQVAWQCAQKDKKASIPCFFVRAFSQPFMLTGTSSTWNAYTAAFTVLEAIPRNQIQ